MPLKNKQTKSIFTSENYYNMHRTAELLMETPFYKKTLAENIELKDKIRYLKYTIELLEMKNKDLQKKLKKRPKKSVKNEEDVYVEIKKEPVETIVIEDSEPIKYEIVENIIVKDEEEEEIIVDASTEDAEEEEEEIIVDASIEDAEEEEEIIVDASIEDAEEDEEEIIVDASIEDAEEEEEVIVDASTEDAEEEEEVTEEVDAEEDEEVIVDASIEDEEADGVYEIVIKGRTYYVSNEVDSFIYQEDENGEISLEVGKFVDSKATFYKK